MRTWFALLTILMAGCTGLSEAPKAELVDFESDIPDNLVLASNSGAAKQWYAAYSLNSNPGTMDPDEFFMENIGSPIQAVGGLYRSPGGQELIFVFELKFGSSNLAEQYVEERNPCRKGDGGIGTLFLDEFVVLVLTDGESEKMEQGVKDIVDSLTSRTEIQRACPVA